MISSAKMATATIQMIVQVSSKLRCISRPKLSCNIKRITTTRLGMRSSMILSWRSRLSRRVIPSLIFSWYLEMWVSNGLTLTILADSNHLLLLSTRQSSTLCSGSIRMS
jgi:hypothetical protein